MKRHLAIALLAGLILLVGQSVHAVPLTLGDWTSLPGTTALDQASLGGTIIVDETQPFSFSAYGGTVSGDVQIRIVRSDVDSTLDFYWRVSNGVDSAGAIQDLRLGSFVSPEYNADYRTDGLGDIGPDRAWLFSAQDGTLNFNFSNGLQPGYSSKFFFLDTTAFNYARTAEYDLSNMGYTQNSDSFDTYAPASAVPEPVTLLLLGIGFASLAGYGRRKALSR